MILQSHQTLERMAGLMVADHVVPADSVIMDLKLCENCASPFARRRNGGTQPYTIKDYDIAGANTHTQLARYHCYGTVTLLRDTGVKYCIRCQVKALAPVDLSAYKEQLPGTENQMRHAMHLPKYDGSLAKVNPAAAVPAKPRRVKRTLGDWKSKLLAAFAESEPLSHEQMREITGHVSYNSLKSALVYFEFSLARVGSVWPRQKCLARGLFTPMSTIQ